MADKDPVVVRHEEEEEGEDSSAAVAAAGEEEDTGAQVAPIVRLEEIAVTTGEEDEDVLLDMKAKLYRFDKEGNQWKERGTGTVKLLKHKENGKVRLVMRQAKTLKICANHLVGSSTKMQEHAGSDKSCVWHAADFADGELKEEMFAIRFGSVESEYIQENYSKIRDVEKELESLTLEMKLTAGPKKAALEHLRKKVEMSTERIRLAKVKEEQAKKAWEAAAQVVKEEEHAKQKLCDDLNRLVQESAASQYTRLEELRKRLESLNPSRASVDVSGLNTTQHATTNSVPQQPTGQNPANATGAVNNAVEPVSSVQQQRPAEAEKKRRPSNSGRGRGGVMILPKGRGGSGSGWTGAGFDVDGGT